MALRGLSTLNNMLLCVTCVYRYLENMVYPIWFGSKDFHNSHKSNLLRKDPEFYGKYNWNVLNNLPYLWPVK